MEANTKNQAMQLAWLTPFGLFAVASMLACYALEDRSTWFILGFAGSCALGSVYGFLQGGLAVWARGGHLGAGVTASLAYQTCFKRISHAAKWRCRHRSFQMTFLFPKGVCGESSFFHRESDGGA
jgi:hypothetical protein